MARLHLAGEMTVVVVVVRVEVWQPRRPPRRPSG